MMMMGRVMCVLAVVLCCTCGYTMAAAAVSSPSAVVPRADESSTAMAFGGHLLRYRQPDGKDFFSEPLPPVESSRKSVNHVQESTTGNNLGRGQSNSDVHSDGVDRNLDGNELSSEEEELRKNSPQGAGEALTPEVDHLQVVEPSSGPTRIDQQKREKEKQQVSPNRDESSTLSPKGITGAEDSSGPGTTTVAGPQSGEKEGDDPETLNTPAQPTISTSSSASVPAESSTMSTSSTNNSKGDSTSGAATGVSAIADTEGTNSTTTPKAVPEINSIASTVKKNVNADISSVSPVWMRTAAPLLIVAVLFTVTVY
ncbi:uncharacterized protein TM35_000551050 [Trypanosoma theileri]|uniref:Mucin TcMUCII n=1 Tax=Trypanosoma theileri TaxID=67003 RepID=A0A1X0NGK3_9TRYP|nr:uncharacterized protein TM35_000551050 [Trypanosoma theileri]ORC83836.1 hypothetical protein TM35_000551050 [Trypanosoma theileri]